MSERASTKGRETADDLLLASASIRPEPSSVEAISAAMKRHLRISIDQDWEGMKYAITGIEEAARDIAAFVTPAMQPVQPLLAARFKLSFNSRGNCETLRPYAGELAGKWVWLVEATDGKNIPLFTGAPPISSGRNLADATPNPLSEGRERS